jgi:uncharacterized protein (TIGR02246 family)
VNGVRPNSSRLRVMLGVAGICLVIFVAMKLRGLTKASNAAAFEAIDQVIKERVEAWNRGDRDGFLACVQDSDDISLYAGKLRFKGRDAVLEWCRMHYSGNANALGTLSLSDVSMELLGAESACVHGSWQVKVSEHNSQDGLFSLIFKKQHDGWRIIHCHISPEP